MPNSTMGKSLAYGFAVIGLLILLFSGYSFVRYVEFQNRIAKLQEEGASLSLEDFSTQVTDSTSDVITYLEPLKKQLHGYNQAIVDAKYSDPETPIDDGAIELFQRLEHTYPQLAQELDRASHYSDRNTGIYEDRDRFSIIDWQQIGQVQSWRSRVLIQLDEHDKSAELSLQLIRFAETVGEPSLLPVLLGNSFLDRACSNMYQAVTAGAVDPKLTSRFADRIGQVDVQNRFLNAVESERAWCLSILLEPELAQLDSFESGSVVNSLLTSVPGGLAGVYGNELLDDLDKALEIAKQPWSQPVEEIESSGFGVPGYYPAAYSDSVSRMKVRIGRTQTMINCIQVVIALESRTWKTENDKQGANLDFLPKSIQHDPFSDAPLKVKYDREAGRWSVYSVGTNKTDDGGPGMEDDHGLGQLR